MRTANLPLFHETAVAQRIGVAAAACLACLAGFYGHQTFETIRRLRPEAYGGSTHAVVLLLIGLPLVGLLRPWRDTTPARRHLEAALLIACYSALLMLEGQILSLL